MLRMSNAKRGVIFDIDGVLVASGPAHRASWQMVARKHGFNLPDRMFTDTFGRPSRDIIRTIWGPATTDAQIHEIDTEKERIYRDLVTGILPLTIGVRETLAELGGAGFVLAVATSGPPENLELVMREGRLGGYFAATVHGFDIKHGKPAPDCFLLAAERAGLLPGNCGVVEDAPVGIEAALAAGMQPIGLVGTHPAERLRTAGARVVERLAEITPALVCGLLDRQTAER